MRGVYTPRRPHASPLFRLVSDHLNRLQTVYDERVAREDGPWRPVAAPPAQGHPLGPQAEPPARHIGAVAVAPKPAHQCSRGFQTRLAAGGALGGGLGQMPAVGRRRRSEIARAARVGDPA